MKKKFTTTLDEDIIIKIKIQALKEHRTVSDLLEKLLKDYLLKQESNLDKMS